MAETEQLISINGYLWVRVPENSTRPNPTYSEWQVRQSGGNPAVVRGPIVGASAVQTERKTDE